jgi:sterol desaturase/sphingolipid hydroxylase (fatty acid hydroxylase superfamily)
LGYVPYSENSEIKTVAALNELMVSHQAVIRLGCFLGVLCVMALWEIMAPRRMLTASKPQRWLSNLGLTLLNTLILRLLFPAAAMGMAALARQEEWGLFNICDIPSWLALVASVVILDLVIYLQHVLMHALPLLWRLHRVHHADLDFDTTTGIRFHPLEAVVSMLIKIAAVAFLGVPVTAVLIFEVLLNATSLFNHGNVRLPLNLDLWLRLILVTPDMHRVHHSIEEDETNTNFGFNLPWWDRLFGTYRAAPRAGHERMTIGICTFRDQKQCIGFPGLLVMPFLGRMGGYAINRGNPSE